MKKTLVYLKTQIITQKVSFLKTTAVFQCEQKRFVHIYRFARQNVVKTWAG